MTIAPGTRVFTCDGVDIGHVDLLMTRRGSPPCLVLALERGARSDDTSVIVTAADVKVEQGKVWLRHVAHRDIDVTGWARPGTHGGERRPSRLDGEQSATAPKPCRPEGREARHG